MEYDRIVILKNGRICHIRNGSEGDAQQMLKNMYLTHGQTDFLLSYPDEQRFDIDEEAKLLGDIAENEREVILLALVDNELMPHEDWF